MEQALLRISEALNIIPVEDFQEWFDKCLSYNIDKIFKPAPYDAQTFTLKSLQAIISDGEVR